MDPVALFFETDDVEEKEYLILTRRRKLKSPALFRRAWAWVWAEVEMVF
jgi:hypothetical protein